MEKTNPRKKILLIANFVSFPSEGNNSRFIYILNMLDTQKIEAELITSDFCHTKKEYREISKIQKNCTNFKITLIHEPKYKKNVSLKRFLSHKILAKNIKQYLKAKKDRPDVVYCAVPSLDVAEVAIKYAKKNRIKIIIDIQDLWPEAFKMIFHTPILSDLFFAPMQKQANYIYKNADSIIGVSNTYIDRALQISSQKFGLSVFLGTDLEKFDNISAATIPNKDSQKNILVYIGTIGNSYDIKSVIDALNILKEKGINNIEFLVMGDGPLRKKTEEYAAKINVKCTFTGKLPYTKMVARLKTADIAINPIRKNAAQSIINKVGDYAAAGLPVINTQECPEYRNLIEKNNAGINCKLPYSAPDIAEAIQKLYSDPVLRKIQGENNRKIAEQKFDRKNSYQKIIDTIGKLLYVK